MKVATSLPCCNHQTLKLLVAKSPRVTTSADVIAAINQRRTRLTLRPEMPGKLPTGWQDWLDAMPLVDGRAEDAFAP